MPGCCHQIVLAKTEKRWDAESGARADAMHACEGAGLLGQRFVLRKAENPKRLFLLLRGYGGHRITPEVAEVIRDWVSKSIT
jgi:hypothetical protein